MELGDSERSTCLFFTLEVKICVFLTLEECKTCVLDSLITSDVWSLYCKGRKLRGERFGVYHFVEIWSRST